MILRRIVLVTWQSLTFAWQHRRATKLTIKRVAEYRISAAEAVDIEWSLAQRAIGEWILAEGDPDDETDTDG